MEDRVRRGRMVTLIAFFLAIVVLGMVGAFGLYMAADEKDAPATGTSSDGGGAAVSDSPTGESEPAETEGTHVNVAKIRRIRRALEESPASRTTRFREVFDRLEKAAVEGRIRMRYFEKFPETLSRAMDDGEVDDTEMDQILTLLQISIIPE